MANWVKALKELSNKQPTNEADIDAVSHEMLHIPSDRGSALVNSAHMESILQITVRAFLVELSTDEQEGLFERDGPLSSFSKLIRIAHAFGVIDRDMQRNLNIAREIRNAFAHAQTFITFETPEIKRACDLLTPWFEKFELNSLTIDHPKAKFLCATTRILMVFANARSSNFKGPFPLRFRD